MTRILGSIPTFKVPYTIMTSIMLASTWLVPFYPKPVSFSALNGANIAHCAQRLAKGQSSPRIHPSLCHRRRLALAAEFIEQG